MTAAMQSKTIQSRSNSPRECSSTAALGLNSCRKEIETAAAAKLSSRGKTLTIRECLLEAGLSSSQASNRTMQARVRREVNRLNRESPRVSPEPETPFTPPQEISIPTIHWQSPLSCSDDEFDNGISEIFDESTRVDDNVSVMTDATCFQPHYKFLAPTLSSVEKKPRENLQLPSFKFGNMPSLSTRSSILSPFSRCRPGQFGLTAESMRAKSLKTTVAVVDFALDAANEWLEAEDMI